jgi:hypothetical protein
MKTTFDNNKDVPQVGNFYNVRCAKMQSHNGTYNYIPVIGGIHSDPQFGTNHRHIHIDGRFIGKNSYFWIDEGITNHIIFVDGEFNQSNKFIEFVVKRRKCMRLTTGIRPPHPKNGGLEYWQWYKSMIGKSCAGKRCPHFGTVMHERDGKLVCPLHNLEGDIETEVITSRPEIDVTCGIIGMEYE